MGMKTPPTYTATREQLEWLKLLTDKANRLHVAAYSPPPKGKSNEETRKALAEEVRLLHDDLRALHRSITGRDAWK